MFCNILGIKKRNKLMIRLGSKAEEIYKLYWEKEEYKIVYPEKTITKERYKNKAQWFFDTYEISMAELHYIIFHVSKKLEGTCEWCNRDYFSWKTRTSEHNNKCDHTGICRGCNEPSSIRNNELCWDCHDKKRREKEYKEELSENEKIEKISKDETIMMVLNGLEIYGLSKLISWASCCTNVEFPDYVHEISQRIIDYNDKNNWQE